MLVLSPSPFPGFKVQSCMLKSGIENSAGNGWPGDETMPHTACDKAIKSSKWGDTSFFMQ